MIALDENDFEFLKEVGCLETCYYDRPRLLFTFIFKAGEKLQIDKHSFIEMIKKRIDINDYDNSVTDRSVKNAIKSIIKDYEKNRSIKLLDS
jgi:hypothetical protein